MKLYNTLTRKLEEFKPLKDKQVSIYSCGPTVYDHIHIGNLSSFIYADILRRVLSAQGYSVKQVMNYTDVDDKTIRRSSEKYPKLDAHEALRKLTDVYIDVFMKDMQTIGNDVDAVNFVRATDYIDQMQKLIKQLHAQGFAYIAEDGVYFAIDEYRKSGKKYGQLLQLSEDSTSTARINNDEYDKDSVHDFALWKVKKDNEPSWPFELDGKQLDGRPGWHIECSVMSAENLGQPFDIHTGGVDLIFPHHENEIAQSTALTDGAYAEFFVHNEHLLVDGKKMSKSLNNFFTLDDIRVKRFDPLAFRLMVLQSHYRSQLNFTWESLEAAQNRLQRLRNAANLRHQNAGDGKTKRLPELDLLRSLSEDLDTPSALAKLDEFLNENTQNLMTDTEGLTELFIQLDDLFGLDLSRQPDITAEQKDVLQRRQIAREARNFEEADRLRDQLAKQGIAINDSDLGQTWSRL